MNWHELLPNNSQEIMSAAFVAIGSNALWFGRQWLWQQWVKRSHRNITQENRNEEEITREQIMERIAASEARMEQFIESMLDPNRPRN